MAKKIFKLTVGSLLIVVLSLMLSSTYAGLTDPSGFILDNGESCALAGGCMCDTTMVANGASCTYGAPGSSVSNDGIRSAIIGFNLCTDVDGCTFTPAIGAPIDLAQGSSCQSDNNPTVMVANGQCTDRDGCFCDVNLIADGASCNYFVAADNTLPTYAGIVNGTTYTNNITIAFADNNPGVTATLNGANFVSNTTVTVNGNYTLIVTDAAHNSVTATFVLNKPAVVVGGGSSGGGGGSYTPPTITSTGTSLTGTTLTGTTTITGVTISKLNEQIDKSLTGAITLLQKSGTGFVSVSTYNIKSVQIKLIVPKYKNLAAKNAIAKMNTRLISLITAKLATVNANNKVQIYSDVSETVSIYNDFMAVFYFIMDMKRADIKPQGIIYFNNFLTNLAKIK